MQGAVKRVYRFGPFYLDVKERLLLNEGEPLTLSPKAFDTLVLLVENSGRLVSKEELLKKVWPDSFVEDNSLNRSISILRRTLGEAAGRTKYIETVPKHGYRFLAEVTEASDSEPLLVIERYISAEIVTEEIDGFDNSECKNGETADERRTDVRATQGEKLSDSHKPHLNKLLKAGFSAASARRGLAASALAIVVALAGAGLWLATNKSNAAKPPAIKSVAVLPFKCLTSDGGDEPLGIGLADVLITKLSSIKNLNVRPTSAVMKFNNNEQDSIAAGQMLGVDAVLEGTIYRAGDRMRITARLVQIKDLSPMWAGQFDEKADDLLLMQNTISQQVASSLTLNLSRDEKDALTKLYTESADAYQLYVTGRYHWSKRDYEGMTRAESFFRKAIEKDPRFALAYLGLADTLTMRDAQHLESEQAINRAIELDGALGEAYASRGFWKMFKAWRWDEAEADFKQAIELKPGYGLAHQWYASLFAITGRVEEAKSQMRRALEIDPTSHNFLADLGQMHYFAREYKEAESYCLKALEIYPDFVFAHKYLADIYIRMGEDDKAIEARLKVDRAFHPFFGSTRINEDFARDQAQSREIYRQSGLRGIWNRNAENLRRAGHTIEHSILLGFYALLGEKEKALECMEKAYENREFMLPFVNVDPMFDDLRSEARFQAVVRRMGLAP